MRGLASGGLARSGTFWHLEKLYPHTADPFVQDTQPASYEVGDVKFAVINERTAIIDPDELGYVRLGIGDPHQRAKGKIRTSAG